MFYEKLNPDKGLDGIFECNVQRINGVQDVIRAHIHEHFELLYCTSGSYELIVEKKTMTLAPGDVVLIRPMQPHQTRTLQDGVNQYTVLKFIPEGLFSSKLPIYELKYIFPLMYSNKQEVEFYTRKQLEGSNLPALLQTLVEETQTRAYGYEMALRSLTEQIVLWFIRQWRQRSDDAPIDEKRMAVIKSVFDYIDEHIEEPLTVAQAAKQFNMGRSTFSRFFSQNAGESLPSYVRRLRLTKAAKALIQTDKSITEIAADAGFSSTSYFVMCFREQNGITPSQFRRHTNSL